MEQDNIIKQLHSIETKLNRLQALLAQQKNSDLQAWQAAVLETRAEYERFVAARSASKSTPVERWNSVPNQKIIVKK